MSTRNQLRHLALGLLLGLGACATTQPVGQQIDDATVQMRVGRALIADPQTSRFGIDVDVVDGVVYLKGEVDSQEEKLQAEKVAANTIGVKEVKNDLTVEGMAPTDDDARSDFAIRAAVGTRLMADPDVSRFDVDVDVDEGVVSLTGVVASERDKAAAERIARGVEGVQQVKNQLQVRPDDEMLEEQPAGDQPQMNEGDSPPPRPEEMRDPEMGGEPSEIEESPGMDEPGHEGHPE